MKRKTKMTRSENIDDAVQSFLDDGGEVTLLKYADQKMQNKSRRMTFHEDKALDGSEKSKTILEHERVREEGMIFSRTDRLKK
jgi:hypothetical protein